MKFLKSTAAIAILALTFSCASIKTTGNALVVKDCTGTYLRIEGKDYLVCNSDMLKNYTEGSKVRASFSKVKDCPEFNGKVACMMYHENEGTIRIQSLN